MTRTHPLLLLAIAASVCTLGGCGKRAGAHTKKNTATAAQTAPAQPAEPAQQHGIRKLKDLDIPVWADGKQIGVLRYGEIPSQVKTQTWAEAPNAGNRFYRLDDYLKSLGVPLERVRSVHLLGNRNKVASIEGDELRAPANKGRFLFDFMEETTGLAKTRWSTDGLKNLYVIHEIRGVSVYVDKPSPAIDPVHQCHLSGASKDDSDLDDDRCAAEDPLANGHKAKGTRVYNDGRLAGYVKRRQLPNSIIVGKDDAGEHKFSLTKFMSTLGVDASQARAIELISNDDVIVRATRADWMKNEKDLYFTLPKHQHGRVRVHIPAAMQAKGDDPVVTRDAVVTAVLVHKHTPPRAQTAVPIEDETPEDSALLARDTRDEKRDREN